MGIQRVGGELRYALNVELCFDVELSFEDFCGKCACLHRLRY